MYFAQIQLFFLLLSKKTEQLKTHNYAPLLLWQTCFFFFFKMMMGIVLYFEMYYSTVTNCPQQRHNLPSLSTILKSYSTKVL